MGRFIQEDLTHALLEATNKRVIIYIRVLSWRKGTVNEQPLHKVRGGNHIFIYAIMPILEAK